MALRSGRLFLFISISLSCMAPGHFWGAWALAPEHQHDVWRDDQTNQQIKERDALDRKANTIGPAKLAEIKRLFEQGQKARADLKLNQAMMIFNKIKAANVPPYSSTAAIILNTELPLHPVPKDCEERFRRADRDLSQGRLDQASNGYLEITRLYPQFEWAYMGLAAIDLRRHQIEYAAKEARSALALNPDLVQAWLVLVHEAIGQQDIEGAIRAAETALALNPEQQETRDLMRKLKEEAEARRLPD
ncbi:MAG: hypothetical protein K2X70_15920 [Candidatus Obscuribacterales bacterium]|nr:hypothetical protein [Candidatus Obscuribacterales bacterium]